MRRNRIYTLLVILLIEKIIQHIVVTAAFYFNLKEIVSTVSASPTYLMILGAIVAVLYALALLRFVSKREWALQLTLALALFDMVGEFVVQGKFDITMTVSFLVVILLLITDNDLSTKIETQTRFII